MAIQSKISIPIPIIGIPDFVFKSRDVPLPESPLLISAEDSERFLSLSSYRDWSCRFAVGLKAYGVKLGDRVFLASHNTIYNAVVFMGAIMAGAIFVGIQATYSIEDMAKQLEQADPKVILAAEDFMPKLLKLPPENVKRSFSSMNAFMVAHPHPTGRSWLLIRKWHETSLGKA